MNIVFFVSLPGSMKHETYKKEWQEDFFHTAIVLNRGCQRSAMSNTKKGIQRTKKPNNKNQINYKSPKP